MEQQRIISLIQSFYKGLKEYNPDSYVSEIPSLPKHLEKSYQKLLILNSQIFFGEDNPEHQLSDIEYNTCVIMRILILASEEFKQNQSKIEMLPKIIKKISGQFNIPVWLKDRVNNYIPLLIVRDFCTDFLDKSIPKEYIVFNNGQFRDYNEKTLTQFKSNNNHKDFSIYIEHTDIDFISILGIQGIFRAGNYHPFHILTLFLQRQGSTITYQEIYQLAIKPYEKKYPRDYSKKVYDYLNHIKNNLSRIKKIKKETDSWFVSGDKKGTVTISNSINSCLITTKDRLFI